MKPSTELVALCGVIRDEIATPEEVARLEQLLADDPTARKFYLRFMQLEALLERYEQIRPPLDSPLPVETHQSFIPRSLLALAACIALAAATYFVAHSWWPRTALSTDFSSGNTPVACVQETDDATVALASSPARPVVGGYHLRADEVFATGSSGAVIRPMDEETVFILGPHTRVSFRRDGPIKTFHLEAGRFFCDVAEQHNGDRWRIVTSDGEATVLGTRLSVSTDRDGTEVAVTSGLVRVTTRETRKSVETPAGFATMLTPNAATMSALPPSEPTRVSSFTLVSSDTGEAIAGLENLTDGSVIDFGKLANRRINIRANCEPRIVGGVRFALSAIDVRNDPIRLTHPLAVGFPKQTELFFPYMVAGDPPTSGGPPLTPYAWTPPLGSYTLTATPYAGHKGKGARGTSLTIKFLVIDGTKR